LEEFVGQNRGKTTDDRGNQDRGRLGVVVRGGDLGDDSMPIARWDRVQCRGWK
jgi:hypothetical protein